MFKKLAVAGTVLILTISSLPTEAAAEQDNLDKQLQEWEDDGIDPNHTEVMEDVTAYIKENADEHFAGRFIDRKERELGVLVFLFTEPLAEEHEENIYDLVEDPAEIEIRIVDYTEEDLLDKQAEIDAGGFNYNDFSIEHTAVSVTDTHVEVGINPYTEENAAVIYEEFGEELVHVVEGAAAYTMNDVNETGMSTASEVENGELNFFQRIAAWFRGLF
ncbi:hypothetical protein K8O68_10870 [Salipaludibacillus sp. CUR1]|uniref:hypothetical protein n=1 Tax=Salipaludibacillus sp. CUR1 TaxID=2820003 RepID=UPI001E2BB2B7|nr:hypothetical protein [Salipaludibacillus sp. CUR1]MCE7792917.1 hypothetical protein [Salipaludibacillus sp. CUR1]